MTALQILTAALIAGAATSGAAAAGFAIIGRYGMALAFAAYSMANLGFLIDALQRGGTP